LISTASKRVQRRAAQNAWFAVIMIANYACAGSATMYIQRVK